VVEREEVKLEFKAPERPVAKREDEEGNDASATSSSASSSSSSSSGTSTGTVSGTTQKKVLANCRHCGKPGHWTRECPLRNMEDTSPKGSSATTTTTTTTTLAGGGSEPSSLSKAADTGGVKRYVVPGMRAGASGSDTGPHLPTRRFNDDTSVRVYNLSEYVTEDKLRDHFEKIGPVIRCRLFTDRRTGKFRGNALVVYSTIEEAEAAIEMFNKDLFEKTRSSKLNGLKKNKIRSDCILSFFSCWESDRHANTTRKTKDLFSNLFHSFILSFIWMLILNQLLWLLWL